MSRLGLIESHVMVYSYILISILKYLFDFTSLQVKSYKQLQIYENEHFQVKY